MEEEIFIAVPYDIFKEWGLSLSEEEEAPTDILEELLLNFMEKALKKAKRKPKAKPLVIVSQEDIESFHKEIQEFHRTAIENAKNFESEGKRTLELLNEISEELLEKAQVYEMRKLFEVAQKIAHINEYGGLQSMKNNEFWQKANLGYFNVSFETKSVLEKNNLSKEELLVLYKILRLGLPLSKSKAALEKSLVQEISFRANTR